jgi:nucleoside-diphosphate-sugar epimerase
MLTTLLRSEKIDFVFHLAACSQPEFATQHPLVAFDVNASGTRRLLEAIRTSGRRIAVIVASSESVYREGAAPFTRYLPDTPCGAPRQRSGR